MEAELLVKVANGVSAGHRAAAGTMAKTRGERRQWERIPVTIPLFVRAVAEGRRVLEFANIVNISSGGALLAVRRYVRRPANISLEIPAAPVAETAGLPASARMMEAKVLRVESAERCYLWAVRFRRPLAAHAAPVRRPAKARAAHA